jgi:cellulose synthase/poly-beta-1,6-N-acetylglucosamine synthase-like glycosyltransferase
MDKEPPVEIVIIFKKLDNFIIESVKYCLKIDYSNFDILLFPDEDMDFPIKSKKIRIIPTGKLSIPKKRNIALNSLSEKTKFVAFIDSDAFPDRLWIKNSMKYFNREITAVGGPNLTPFNEEFSRKISGNVIKQKIAFGPGAIRHNISPTQRVKELPACNLIVRKEFFKENIFDESLATGEDAKLCSEIILNRGGIIYAKDVVVFHHRRKIFLPLIKQFYNYGFFKSKLFFQKKLFSAYYAVPSLFLLYLILGIVLSVFFRRIFYLFLLSLFIYFLLIFASSVKNSQKFSEIFPTTISVFFVHIAYGWGFILGFFNAFIFNKNKNPGVILSNE